MIYAPEHPTPIRPDETTLNRILAYLFPRPLSVSLGPHRLFLTSTYPVNHKNPNPCLKLCFWGIWSDESGECHWHNFIISRQRWLLWYQYTSKILNCSLYFRVSYLGPQIIKSFYKRGHVCIDVLYMCFIYIYIYLFCFLTTPNISQSFSFTYICINIIAKKCLIF